MKRQTLLALMALAIASAPVAAQGYPKPDSVAKAAAARVVVPAYRNRVVGVYDGQTFQPLEGVEVSDVMGGNKSLTSSTGNVSLFFLPEGASLVRVRKVGYAVQTFLVSITPQDSSPITVVLSHVTELSAVVTTGDSTRHYTSPGLRGFQERSKGGFGYFVDDAELRKREDQKLADVITAKVPGVSMQRVGGNASYLTSQRIGLSGTCYPDVFLDGTLLAKQPDPRAKRVNAVDLNQFDVTTLAGVEFYAGGATLPPEFNGTGSGCGALLLWTRER